MLRDGLYIDTSDDYMCCVLCMYVSMYVFWEGLEGEARENDVLIISNYVYVCRTVRVFTIFSSDFFSFF